MLSLLRARVCVCVTAVVAVLVVAPATAMDVPPLITATGSYYAVGLEVGRQASDIIALRRNRSGATWDYLLTSEEARMLNQSLYNSSLWWYPELVDEMRGIAQGSGQPFEVIFFLNIITELEGLQQELSEQTPRRLIGQCTDVFSSGVEAAQSVWGHNEDSSAHDCNATYMVNATILDGNGEVAERFVAYTYAASVAGRAFGWNRHGVIITTNALFPNLYAFDNPLALPRAVKNRAMYRARSVDDAIRLATGIPTVSAFALNVGTWDVSNWSGDHRIPAQFHNVETAPNGAFAVTPIYPRPREARSWVPSRLKSTNYHFYHTNNYNVLQANSTYDPDSGTRMARLNQFPVPSTSEDVREMLGDTYNTTYPVWQHGGISELFTMATVVFHFPTEEILIYTSNPKVSNATLRFSRL